MGVVTLKEPRMLSRGQNWADLDMVGLGEEGLDPTPVGGARQDGAALD